MSDRLNRPLALIRLAGLPLSLTLLSILSGSVINRVMVVELGLPVILAGLFLAIPLLISPVRIWLGHLSDAYPLWGRRREPYLIVGALLAGIGVALSVALVVRTPAPMSPASALIDPARAAALRPRTQSHRQYLSGAADRSLCRRRSALAGGEPL